MHISVPVDKGLWLAGVLTGGPDALLGYRSAAALWGLCDPRPGVEVITRGHDHRTRGLVNLDGEKLSVPLYIRNTRHLSESDLSVVRSVPVTSVGRTLLDYSSVTTPKGLKRAFIQADRLGLLDDDELSHCLARGRGRPGAADFRSLAGRRVADVVRSKSILEGLFLDLCAQNDIPHPEVNVPLSGHEPDCLWRSHGLIVELESWEFHRGREKFEADAARDNHLRSEGWTVLRVTWRMVTEQPALVATQVRRALRIATGPKR